MDCEECNGTGTCPECEAEIIEDCENCDGTNECPNCGGSGIV